MAEERLVGGAITVVVDPTGAEAERCMAALREEGLQGWVEDDLPTAPGETLVGAAVPWDVAPTPVDVDAASGRVLDVLSRAGIDATARGFGFRGPRRDG